MQRRPGDCPTDRDSFRIELVCAANADVSLNRPEPGIAWQTKSVRPVRLQATMGARHAASLSPVPVPLGTRKVNFDFDDVRFKV
jgi:hypothetical protein